MRPAHLKAGGGTARAVNYRRGDVSLSLCTTLRSPGGYCKSRVLQQDNREDDRTVSSTKRFPFLSHVITSQIINVLYGVLSWQTLPLAANALKGLKRVQTGIQ